MRWLAAIGLVLLMLIPASAAADGAADPTFGSGGYLSLAPARFSGPSGLVIDQQGRMLLGATLEDGSLLRTRAAVLRLLPDGTLDTSFGSGGVVVVEPPAPYRTTRAETFAVDPQGRMVIAGEVDDDVPSLTRLLPDGTPDPAFGSGGMLVAKGAYDGAPAWWLSLAFSGSSIVVAGAAENTPPYGTGLGATAVLARIADNGTPDPAFGNGGFVEFPGTNVTFASGHALAIDGRGRAVLGIWRATTTDFPGDVSAAVVRVTASGALDGTFGSGGQVLLGGLKGRAPLISLTRSGGIVALGAWAALTPGGTILVARLKPNGQLDPAFGTGGEVEATGVPPSNGALDCRGNLIVTGPGGLTRYGPDGRLDPSFKTPAAPPVPVGDTTGVPVFGLFAFAPGGRLMLAGGVNDGPSVIGGATQVGHSAIALARVAASCPIADSRPPTVGLDVHDVLPASPGDGAGRPGGRRCPARPARRRADRRAAAARPGTAGASQR